MEIVRALKNLEVGPSSVVTVGVFDGVHLGHQVVMGIVRAAAADSGARSVAVTFDRNPQELIRPAEPAPYITTLAQKLDLIAEQDMDVAVTVPVEREFLDMSAEQFVRAVLHEKLSAVRVVVGTDFAFGSGRAGDVGLLRRMGKELGFEVIAVSPVRIGDISVSSTAIRGLLTDGKIEQANELLGHPFALVGKVVAGEGVGRSLGFPTANIQPAERQVLPASGVYAVLLELGGTRRTGVANIGNRPTVGGGAIGVEVYIMGFSGDIYGRELELSFYDRLRGEVHFSSADALKRQIGRDVERASRLIG